jgi:SAM-dependent methyltransferase
MKAHSIVPPDPSPWVRRWANLIAKPGPVLDVACGGGRHAILLAELGYRVEAVDRDVSAILARVEDGRSQIGMGEIKVRAADLEGAPWPYEKEQFTGVVVTNYLHRPLLPHLVAALKPGGVLIYETFARGNEQFGKPSNPDFLLRSGELLEAVRGEARVIAYEDLIVDLPRPACVQHICAVRGGSA